MNTQKGPIQLSILIRLNRIPLVAIIVDSVVSVVLCGLGLYHFTQPNQAWISGTFESLSALLLLTAAYLVHRTTAMAINLIVAVPVFCLGIWHLTHGGGWKSGITELFFFLILVVIAYIIYRSGKSK